MRSSSSLGKQAEFSSVSNTRNNPSCNAFAIGTSIQRSDSCKAGFEGQDPVPSGTLRCNRLVLVGSGDASHENLCVEMRRHRGNVHHMHLEYGNWSSK